jgi:hypothetical protein
MSAIFRLAEHLDPRQKDDEYMSEQKVKVLGLDEALWLGRDAKIVAIRWDLIPWCLVLDCDVPLQEDVENSPTRRAWMIFDGIHEISWTVNSARLPNGFFMTNAIVASKCIEGFFQYELPILTPTFSSANKLNSNPYSKLIIIAKELRMATSIAVSHFGEFGPNRQQRNALASEEDFLRAVLPV